MSNMEQAMSSELRPESPEATARVEEVWRDPRWISLAELKRRLNDFLTEKNSEQ